MRNTDCFVIRWNTRDSGAIEAIRKRFGIPGYTTLNGWSPAEITHSDLPVFEECARRNFFSILPKKWYKNGDHYIFKSCK